jgi:hypothetical protein
MKEYTELIQLANHVCLREFPHLLSTPEVSITSTEQALTVFSKVGTADDDDDCKILIVFNTTDDVLLPYPSLFV